MHPARYLVFALTASLCGPAVADEAQWILGGAGMEFAGGAVGRPASAAPLGSLSLPLIPPASSGGNVVEVIQMGEGLEAQAIQRGEGNVLLQSQQGRDNRLLGVQIGNGNFMQQEQVGTGLSLTVRQLGDGGAVRIYQQ